jgi:hypothetical protein
MGRPTVIFPGVSTSGGGGGTSSQKLLYGDGTELSDTSSKVSQGSTADEIVMRIDSGQAAGSGGVDGMVGGMVWDIGSTITGPACLEFDWVAMPSLINVCVVILRAASKPASLADIDGNTSSRILQLRVSGAGGVSTFIKRGNAALATTNSENKTSSVSAAFQVAIDEKGIGGALSRHTFSSGTGTQIRTDSNNTEITSGTVYVALLFSAAGTASGNLDVKARLRGGMPT